MNLSHRSPTHAMTGHAGRMNGGQWVRVLACLALGLAGIFLIVAGHGWWHFLGWFVAFLAARTFATSTPWGERIALRFQGGLSAAAERSTAEYLRERASGAEQEAPAGPADRGDIADPRR